ncbi:hypothetical protein DEAC_c38190 [Desulfosporosinus acididurans]|uniref:Uncharacterized protein n=1 Tax=Desulfosporosinus acididurans TaxID=476652 RepID=A0A0J1IHM7_9FIRM|nr:hypothetical protein DEAC_c38190 [Desulfosporosinus acididurans]
MSFYIYLISISLLYLCIGIILTRRESRKSIKRGFVCSYFFTLLTFFVAVDSSFRKYSYLVVMITSLTLYNIYLLKFGKND